MSKKVKKSKRTRHIPAIDEEHWDAFNAVRKKYSETWGDTFERFYNYMELTEHFFTLPKEVDRGAKTNAVTVMYYLPLWLENMYINFIKAHVVDLRDIKELRGTAKKGTAALVIGAGPSLWKYDHLKMLAESDLYNDHKGIIFAVSRSLKTCLDAGVVPDYVTVVDAEPVMVEHFDYDIVDEHSDEIVGIFSAHTHPDVLERWHGGKIFCLSSIPDVTIPNVQGVISGLFPNLTEFNTGAHVGAFSWNLAVFMGYNPVAMIGLDCAFLPETPIEETPYYYAYKPSHPTTQDMIDKCYHFHTHSFFKNNCYTDDAHYGFMETCVALAKTAKEQLDVTTFNCTGGGVIDDPAIENMHFADWLKSFED